MGNVEGAEFKIYAAEDIYSPDYQCDREGNRITLYRKDELVSMIKTDKDGKAELTDLPLGRQYSLMKMEWQLLRKICPLRTIMRRS